MLTGRSDHLFSVMNIAISDNTFEIFTWYWQHKGTRTSGDEEAIIARLGTIVGGHDTLHSINCSNLFAEMERDVILAIPLELIEHDVLYRLFTR